MQCNKQPGRVRTWVPAIKFDSSAGARRLRGAVLIQECLDVNLMRQGMARALGWCVELVEPCTWQVGLRLWGKQHGRVGSGGIGCNQGAASAVLQGSQHATVRPSFSSLQLWSLFATIL